MEPANRKTSIPHPLLAPISDDSFLVNTLAELTSQDHSTVQQRLKNEENELGWNVGRAMAEWQLQPYEWSEKLIEFYRSTDAFLFETLMWNRHPLKNAMRDWIGKWLYREHSNPVRILTYGDGLGIDSLYCALAGHQVDYYEVSERCVEFSRRLAKRLGVELNVIRNQHEISCSSYDYVVCLDVLEHVPDPPQIVAEIASYLKPGGRLIVHAPFWYLSSPVPTHLASNLAYSGEVQRLYRIHGLNPIDACLLWNPIVLEKSDSTGNSPRPVPLSRRAKILGGGLLLKGARIWKAPYQWGAKFTLKNSKQNHSLMKR